MAKFRAILLSTALIGIVTMLAAGAGPAAAQQVINKPIYFPATKSYFELVKTRPDAPPGSGIGVVDWQEAKVLAERRQFKGVQGRLAVVKDAVTNQFLRENFKPIEQAWIGLRYWCAFGKLQWVTGEEHPLTAYANWDVIWNRNSIGRNDGAGEATCPRDQRGAYLGVHYWTVNEGFVWNAHVPQKKFALFFVEYPTGTE